MLMNDLRLALRQLHKNPGFALAIVLTLAWASESIPPSSVWSTGSGYARCLIRIPIISRSSFFIARAYRPNLASMWWMKTAARTAKPGSWFATTFPRCRRPLSAEPGE